MGDGGWNLHGQNAMFVAHYKYWPTQILHNTELNIPEFYYTSHGFGLYKRRESDMS